jgi:hypothetical protein
LRGFFHTQQGLIEHLGPFFVLAVDRSGALPLLTRL